jgi:hypothetical protein
LEGLLTVSCACNPLSFNGMWNPVVTPNSNSAPSTATLCSTSSCQDEKSGSNLYAQSYICYGPSVTDLYTYAADLRIRLVNTSCVNVSVSVVSGHAYSRAPESPIALPFLQTNYDLIGNNTYAVVTNHKGVVIGQIAGSMIHLQVESNLRSFLLDVSPCLSLDLSMKQTDGTDYSVYDLGILSASGSIQPLGLKVASNKSSIHSTGVICFDVFFISENFTSFILIERVSNYENMNAYTNAEEAIVITSGVLFCFGALVMMVLHLITTFNVPVAIVGIQSFCLLSFRGVYFLVLSADIIPIGGLLDFALIEIPTFIYIGIFIEIILASYQFFIDRQGAKRISKNMLILLNVMALLLNWIVFAAIMIAMAFSSNTSVEQRTCNCQISHGIQQSDSAQIIRIVYKSIVLVSAVCVVGFTRYFRYEVLKAGGLQVLYHQVVFLSLGLFFDCVAFVIYDAVNSPTAYFLIVLWFTELLPICTLNGVLTTLTNRVTLQF